MVTQLVKEGMSSKTTTFHNSHCRKPTLLLSKHTPTPSQDTILICKNDVELMGFKAFRGHASLAPVLTAVFQLLCTNRTGEQGPGVSGEAV